MFSYHWRKKVHLERALDLAQQELEDLLHNQQIFRSVRRYFTPEWMQELLIRQKTLIYQQPEQVEMLLRALSQLIGFLKDSSVSDPARFHQQLADHPTIALLKSGEWSAEAVPQLAPELLKHAMVVVESDPWMARSLEEDLRYFGFTDIAVLSSHQEALLRLEAWNQPIWILDQAAEDMPAEAFVRLAGLQSPVL
ncbi:hypothetical protein RZS08_20800, partial [Arthrospira platensis SPKY1]|nr:hypothetical protein [Arthrospira platensis SPKY1]